MTNKHILLLLAFLPALFSCQDNKGPRRLSIPIVESTLSDTTSRNYSLLRSYSPGQVEGSIFLFGTPEEVIQMTEEFLTADRHNNIDGNHNADELPDFSGETIAALMDIANSPYDDYFVLSNENFIKELTVRNFLFAMDTLALQSPYDTLHPVRKAKAKMVVLASSYASMYGAAEIDTLCRVANPAVPVVSMLDVMSVKALETGDNFLVWTTRDKLDRNVFADYFKHLPGRLARKGTLLTEFHWHQGCPAPDSLRDDGTVRARLLDLLDDYLATQPRRDRKVGSILLDDPLVNADQLQEALESLKRTDEDNLLIYRNLLSPRCRVVSPGEAVTEYCYQMMRENNTFTHKIAYPALKCYVTTPAAYLPESLCDVDGSLAYSYNYGRESGQARPSFSFVELRDRYFSETWMEFMEEKAPKTFSLYVR
ncbi:MAG: hypothetical protein IJ652_04040 [Bacteroidales bacterium]|nr:hypothetical protein [Bacteroidales bacterium]